MQRAHVQALHHQQLCAACWSQHHYCTLRNTTAARLRAQSPVVCVLHCHVRDNVWLGTGTGVEIINPQGKRLGHINLPDGGVANFCIGANKQLLLLQEDHISMIELRVAGAPLP